MVKGQSRPRTRKRRRKSKWYESWGRRFESCRGRHIAGYDIGVGITASLVRSYPFSLLIDSALHRVEFGDRYRMLPERLATFSALHSMLSATPYSIVDAFSGAAHGPQRNVSSR